MQVYVAVTPDQTREVLPYTRALAHVAYRIGPDSVLLRQNLPLRTSGGLLSISDREAAVIQDPDALCAAVLRECGRWSFSGAVLDLEEPVRRDRLVFAEKLGAALSKSRRTLFLPERYSSAAANAAVLVCTAVSGGSFTQFLQEQVQARGGPSRIALDVQRLRMDLALPAKSGEGTPLSGEALRQLMDREEPQVFFSPELCARYFTYIRDGEAHFVLFDDADTLGQKVKIGAAMGIPAAFFMWPEIRDIAAKMDWRH